MDELKHKFKNYSRIEDKDSCIFNEVIICDDPTMCGKCGWNPKVSEQRIQRMRETPECFRNCVIECR